jgi:nucleoside-diphosphate-sugar epimerase
MRVLVTGGSGYLGGAIVKALAGAGHEPIVFARRARTAGLPGRAVEGDVRDRGAVLAAAQGADAIVHTAALVSQWQAVPALFDDINVGGLEVALDVARSLGISRTIYTSSFLALPPAGRSDPLLANDYQRSKVRALALARDAARSGLPMTTLIPGVVYGPGAITEGNLINTLVRDHYARRLPGIVGAGHTWSFAYIDDVADAHVRALTPPLSRGAEYLLGGVNAPQIRIFELMRKRVGTPLPRRIPFAAASAAGWIEERRAAITRWPPRITRGAVNILRYDWPMDSTRSVDELNYRMTPLENGLNALFSVLS